MEGIIGEYLDQLKIGRRQSYKNLTLFPLLSSYSSSLDYILLDEALRQDLIEVTEVDAQGSVSEIKVKNRSPRRVLILDGEELVGAKQNRMVNTTILIQGNADIVIPVSCVEQGRWSYETTRFSSGKRIVPSRLRAMKAEHVRHSVRESGQFQTDQGAIWSEISERVSRRGAESPSRVLAEIYEKDRSFLQEYGSHFRCIDSQVGAVFMINGRVAGMEGFGKADSFVKTFKKLVESYVLDAVDSFEPEKEHKALKSETTRFLKACRSSREEPHPSIGLGTDLRFESRKISGFALSYEKRILHLCFFSRENGKKKHWSPMVRNSQNR